MASGLGRVESGCAETGMEREANYAAVGAFVLLVVAMAALFVYWYSDRHDRRDYTRYEIYFQGSVSGLERGAPVRYLGVDVGRVVDTRIDPRDSSRVQVIVDIDAQAPVSRKTVAELSLQGVTGLLYIDLIENTGNRPLSEIVPSMEYPVIRSARSNFDIFLASLPDLVAIASRAADRATRLLSDENIAAVSRTLESIDEASSTLPATLREIQGLVKDLRAASEQISAAAARGREVLDNAGPELVAAVEHVRSVAENMENATARLDKLVGENRRDLRVFLRDGLPELERLAVEGQQAAREIRDLSRSLRENPSQLLYQPREQGVEIPR